MKIYITTLPVGFEPTTSKLTAWHIHDFATEDLILQGLLPNQLYSYFFKYFFLQDINIYPKSI